MSTPKFEERVAFMLIALNESEPFDPGSPLADQIEASISEGQGMRQALPAVAEASMEDGFDHIDREHASPDVVAFLLAAVSDDDIVSCSHLSSPQPVIANLTGRWIMCRACALRAPRDSPGLYDDSCDYCRTTGLTKFWPIVSVLGSVVVSGEACDDCAERVRQT